MPRVHDSSAGRGHGDGDHRIAVKKPVPAEKVFQSVSRRRRASFSPRCGMRRVIVFPTVWHAVHFPVGVTDSGVPGGLSSPQTRTALARDGREGPKPSGYRIRLGVFLGSGAAETSNMETFALIDYCMGFRDWMARSLSTINNSSASSRNTFDVHWSCSVTLKLTPPLESDHCRASRTFCVVS